MGIYFKEEYGKLYEDIDEGKLEIFKSESSLGKIQNMFIKREISTKINNTRYYDLITPYGYGGPIIIDIVDEDSKDKLIEKYYKDFQDYCKGNNIVSEFIRFHPLIENHKDFENVYNIEYLRKTLGTNLKDYDDPFQKEFSKSSRKRVRRMLREGFSFSVEENPDNINEFIDIYNETMDRNEADSYYYFGREYFDSLINKFRSDIIIINGLYEGEVVASELALLSDNIIHAHLGGTRNKYYELAPNYITMYGMTIWGKENGYDLIHAGGGRTNSEEDGLYKFKKRFAQNTEFDYYVGKKIWNSEIYDKLCDIMEVDKNTDFFPAYRLGE